MEEMTLHRALAELSTLDSRINDAIEEGIFVKANLKTNKKISGMDIAEYERMIQASYDKVESLISRRNKIKSCLTLANAGFDFEKFTPDDLKKIEIAGQKMTIVEAIEKKGTTHRRGTILYEEKFLEALKTAYMAEAGKVNRENEKLPEKFETYVQKILGGKENLDAKQLEDNRKSFTDANSWDLIDPLKIREKIEKLEEKITKFQTEANAAISEYNAVIKIKF